MQRRMETKQEMAYGVQGYTIPRLFTLRRVSERYQQILPLGVMKRYQCVVVSGARKMLTVAITDYRYVHIFKPLSKLTGCAIFPVLVDPARMRLLIRRIERAKYKERNASSHLSAIHRQQMHSMLMLLTSPRKKQYKTR